MGNSFSILFSLVNFVVFMFILAYFDFRILLIFTAGNSLYVICLSCIISLKDDYQRFTHCKLRMLVRANRLYLL